MNTQPAEPAIAPTPWPVMVQLSGMMFLQYFIQGSFVPIASIYLQGSLNFSPKDLGNFGMAISVGPLLAPLLLGQLVDRLLPTERVLAACQFLAGLLMIALYYQTEQLPIILLAAAYAMLYVPTQMLSNSLAFQHLNDRRRDFPWVRIWGTLGFITPAWGVEYFWLSGLQGDELNASRGIMLLLAGIAGIVMAVYCLLLVPHTPPRRNATSGFAPAAALSLLQRRDILVLAIASFFIMACHKYVLVWNSPYLRAMLDSVGITGAWEARIASIGQISELAVMACLGLLLARFGYKITLTIGATAYMVRCLLFAGAAHWGLPLMGSMSIIALGQAMHGFCFACFLAASFMYVDRESPADARGSMQILFGTFWLGLGAITGGYASGRIGEAHKNLVDSQSVFDWTSMWLICAAVSAACVAFLLFFFPRETAKT